MQYMIKPKATVFCHSVTSLLLISEETVNFRIMRFMNMQMTDTAVQILTGEQVQKSA